MRMRVRVCVGVWSRAPIPLSGACGGRGRQSALWDPFSSSRGRDTTELLNELGTSMVSVLASHGRFHGRALAPRVHIPTSVLG